MERNRRNDSLRDLCVHEGDGINPRLERKRSSLSIEEVSRKDLQLCKWAGKVVAHGLRARAADPLLVDLDVVAVDPAPDASRLRVWCAPAGQTTPERLAAAQRRLLTLRAQFRAELAASIRRKRVPELTFVVCPMEDLDEK